MDPACSTNNLASQAVEYFNRNVTSNPIFLNPLLTPWDSANIWQVPETDTKSSLVLNKYMVVPSSAPEIPQTMTARFAPATGNIVFERSTQRIDIEIPFKLASGYGRRVGFSTTLGTNPTLTNPLLADI